MNDYYTEQEQDRRLDLISDRLDNLEYQLQEIRRSLEDLQATTLKRV